jgi:thymidylate kinase
MAKQRHFYFKLPSDSSEFFLERTVRIYEMASMNDEFRQTGLCLAVLGSDGAGKSTLLTRLQTLLKPVFPEQQTIHFRPRVWEKKKTGVVTDPHGRPPRNILMSWLKVGFYFVDHWAGWWLVVRPAKRRGMLVIFDRDFDDLLVDERRYRLRGTRVLVRVLRRLLPRPDHTFVLSAPAKVLHQRKPELPEVELERQQKVLEQFADSSARYSLISAEQTPEQVAQAAWREVMICIAEQKERKGGT